MSTTFWRRVAPLLSTLSVVALLAPLAVSTATRPASGLAGDATGDCRAELALGRNSGDGMRFEVLAFDQVFGTWGAVLDDGGSGWGDSRAVSALAFGDVDGDGDAELAVGRDSGDGMRFEVQERDPVSGAWSAVLEDGGSGWGDSRGVTALTMGDFDGDGDDELAVGRNSGGGVRFQVWDHDQVTETWSLEQDGGSGWGDGRGVTALAAGDVDGDGDDELALGRNSGGGMRFQVWDRDRATGAWVTAIENGGSGWGDSRAVTGLALGDVDGDGDAELAIGRDSGGGMRYEVLLRDESTGAWLPMLTDGGSGWGDSRGVTAVALGDVDGDGDDELAVGRDPGDGMRFEVLERNPEDNTWAPLIDDGGSGWGDDRGIGDLAFGDVDGDGDDELALGRTSGDGMRSEVWDRDRLSGTWSALMDNGSFGWGDSRGVTALALPRTAHDADADGLSDCIERNGFDADGDGVVDVDLPAMGADPLRIDVFVEVDCLVGANVGGAPSHSHCPTRQALRQAVAAFAAAPVRNPDGRLGVQLHLDSGELAGPGVEDVTGPGGVGGNFGNFGGGNAIAEAGNQIVDLDGAVGDPGTDLDVIRDANFDPDRRPVFRYALFGHQTNFRKPLNDCTSGRSPDPDVLVTLGGTRSSGSPCWTVDANGFSVGSDDEQAGTLVHELGHNLGLGHGGTYGQDDSGTNNKPNYLSTMNYLFQMCGVPVSPLPGVPGGCDYSRMVLPDLDEASLDECAGIDGGVLGFGPMNWDGGSLDGATCAVPTANVSADVNGDGAVTVLAGREDWSALEYRVATDDPGDAGDGGVDAETLAAVRKAFGANLRPVVAVSLEPVAGDPGRIRVVVANRGGGPVLGARVALTAPPASALVPLGAVTAGAQVSHELVVPGPSRCGGVVSVVVTATDFFGSPYAVKASRAVGPVCPGAVGSVTGSTGPSPTIGELGVVAPPAAVSRAS